jgi:hypothetical protein
VTNNANGSPAEIPARKKYVRAVGPRLRSVLYALIGLGNASQVDGLEVIWPGGGRQIVNQPRIDGLTIIEQEPTR